MKSHESRRVSKYGPVVARYKDRDIFEWIVMADGSKYEYAGTCGVECDLAKLKAGQCVMAPGLIYQKIFQGIKSDQAYVAIREDGFVDGACFTESSDAQDWCREMEAAGFRIEVRDRAEAKRILFTTIAA